MATYAWRAVFFDDFDDGIISAWTEKKSNPAASMSTSESGTAISVNGGNGKKVNFFFLEM